MCLHFYIVLSVARFHYAIYISCCVALCYGLALIIELFASRYADLKLCHALFVKVQAERDERQALLRECRVYLSDLAPVEQELARTHRVYIIYIAVVVRADVHAVYEYLAVLDLCIAFLEVYASLADGFYLCACQDDARLVFFFYKIIVKCFLV